MKYLILIALIPVCAYADITFKRDTGNYELKVRLNEQFQILKGIDRDITPTVGKTLHVKTEAQHATFFESWLGGKCGMAGYVAHDYDENKLEVEHLGGCGQWYLSGKDIIIYNGFDDQSYTDGLCGLYTNPNSWIHTPVIYKVGLVWAPYLQLKLNEYLDNKVVKNIFRMKFEFIKKHINIGKINNPNEVRFCNLINNDENLDILIREFLQLGKL